MLQNSLDVSCFITLNDFNRLRVVSFSFFLNGTRGLIMSDTLSRLDFAFTKSQWGHSTEEVQSMSKGWKMSGNTVEQLVKTGRSK